VTTQEIERKMKYSCGNVRQQSVNPFHPNGLFCTLRNYLSSDKTPYLRRNLRKKYDLSFTSIRYLSVLNHSKLSFSFEVEQDFFKNLTKYCLFSHQLRKQKHQSKPA